ncbi:MAG: hypothetical protein WCQ54_01525 [Clostridiaceae bacterium]
MEIIDIRKEKKERLVPICKLEKNIVFMEADKKDFPFSSENVKNYFAYNLNSGELGKIDIGKEKAVYDFSRQKTVEGEDAFYYLTEKKQLFLNEYTIYKVNMESLKPEPVFKFSEEKRYSTFLIERLDEKRFVVFFKENEKFSIEDFENMDYGKDKYGFDKGVLYNIETGESFEINDRPLLKGLKGVFFTTVLKGEKVIVYEENYLETFQKEPIYMDIHMHRVSSKDKFYYHDRLKYISAAKFIDETEKGADELSFINIEDYGIEGFEIFIGSDEENIFYETDTYGKEDANAITFLNKDTMNKKMITLKSLYEDKFSIVSPSYFNYLDGREKYIFTVRLISDNEVNIKEIIHQKIDYTYDIKHGALKECIDNRYLILTKGERFDETSVIDTESGNINSYNREHMVFDEYLILY